MADDGGFEAGWDRAMSGPRHVQTDPATDLGAGGRLRDVMADAPRLPTVPDADFVADADARARVGVSRFWFRLLTMNRHLVWLQRSGASGRPELGFTPTSVQEQATWWATATPEQKRTRKAALLLGLLWF